MGDGRAGCPRLRGWQKRGSDALVLWAERTADRGGRVAGRGRLRFAFYGRVPAEDWQDPVTSSARQQQAAMLVAGHGVMVAEFFDAGESRTLPWARRPRAAALVAALADPGRGWDAIVIGEIGEDERAFYGSQYASMAPLFEHYGVQLWMPEVGGRVDWHAGDHERGAVFSCGSGACTCVAESGEEPDSADTDLRDDNISGGAVQFRRLRNRGYGCAG